MFLAHFFPLSERSGTCSQPWFSLLFWLLFYFFCPIHVSLLISFNSCSCEYKRSFQHIKWNKIWERPSWWYILALVFWLATVSIYSWFVFTVYRFHPWAYTLISFLVFSGLSIDFNFYKTFWSLQVNFVFRKHDYLVKEKSVLPHILLPCYWEKSLYLVHIK